jgi:hypothetical protein
MMTEIKSRRWSKRYAGDGWKDPGGKDPGGKDPGGKDPGWKGRSFAGCFAAIAGIISLCSGCMDGPFYAMNSAMPWTQRAWRQDEEYGATFTTRVAEFETLKAQIPSMPQEEKERWSNILSEMMDTETSPELRRLSVECLAMISSPIADEGLTKASEDKVDKVRITACKAWLQRKSDTSKKMLTQIAVSDQSPSVRIAALEALGETAGGVAKEAFEMALEDNDPAIQFQAAQSLKQITGEDFGGDIEAWQNYLANSPGFPEEPKVAEQTWFGLPTIIR